MRRRVLLFALSAVLLVLAGATSARAQGAPGSQVPQALRAPEVAAYQGPDREQKLIEGAKREKELTFYSSVPPDDIAALVAAFDKKYGLKVKAWRADSEGILQRVISESRARRYEADIVAASSSALEPLARENLLQEVASPALADIMPEAIAPHRQWVAIYLSRFVQAYNTYLVEKATLPKSFADLTRPQWRGKLGIEAEDYDWFGQVVTDLGEAAGLRLFSEMVATNGISVRKGHNLLVNLVAAGEVPFALTAYGFLAEQAKRKGAPVDWIALPPAVARATAQGLTRNAPHPNAAVLFYDFLIGEGQQILAARQFVPSSRKVESPMKGSFKLIDTALMLDQSRRWQELFQRTIIGPSR